MAHYLKNEFISYFCYANINVNKQSGIRKYISSFFPKIRTCVVEKRLLTYQEKIAMTLKSPLLRRRTFVTKDKSSIGQEKLKYNLIG